MTNLERAKARRVHRAKCLKIIPTLEALCCWFDTVKNQHPEIYATEQERGRDARTAGELIREHELYENSGGEWEGNGPDWATLEEAAFGGPPEATVQVFRHVQHALAQEAARTIRAEGFASWLRATVPTNDVHEANLLAVLVADTEERFANAWRSVIAGLDATQSPMNVAHEVPLAIINAVRSSKASELATLRREGDKATTIVPAASVAHVLPIKLFIGGSQHFVTAFNRDGSVAFGPMAIQQASHSAFAVLLDEYVLDPSKRMPATELSRLAGVAPRALTRDASFSRFLRTSGKRTRKGYALKFADESDDAPEQSVPPTSPTHAD